MRKQDGFTLIESLVATGVLAVALAALPALMISTLRANQHAGSKTIAANLAQEKLEQLIATPAASLASGSDAQPLDAYGNAGGIYQRGWTVTAGPTGATTSLVTVSVTWPDRAASPSVSVATVVSE